MAAGPIEGLPMPEDPLLRQVAEVLEESDRIAEVLDREWRIVYVTSAMIESIGLFGKPAGYGLSMIERSFQFPDYWGSDPVTIRTWWRANAPFMRWSLEPDASQFGELVEQAARVEPAEPPPIWSIAAKARHRRYGDDASYEGRQMFIRLNERDGSFAGVAIVTVPAARGAVLGLLSMGDMAMYERMARMAEPHRCPTAILFGDIEASGELSRTVSSKAYFDLIRGVMRAFDEAVIADEGIVGVHAGDGANAFFCPPDHSGSVSRAVAAAISAARTVRRSVATLDVGTGAPPAVNFGLHWGETVMMGQIATGGRLEVTAIGDEVNEAARIQDAAKGGKILASKDLIERLDFTDAAELGIDPDSIAYTPLGGLEGVSDKTLRDAATIPVAEL